MYGGHSATGNGMAGSHEALSQSLGGYSSLAGSQTFVGAARTTPAGCCSATNDKQAIYPPPSMNVTQQLAAMMMSSQESTFL
jgi:hypothetical protein